MRNFILVAIVVLAVFFALGWRDRTREMLPYPDGISMDSHEDFNRLNSP